MNRDLAMLNSLLYRTTNDRRLLFSRSKLSMVPVVRKNQTINKIVTYSEVLNNCVEYSRFPNFVEMM